VRLLSGLRRVMPVSFVLAVVAALAMAGVPPLGGFISKELFFETMLELGTVPITLAVIGSIFTFAYSFKFLSVFFGKLNAPEPEKLHEASPQLWGTVMPLAVAAVVFGVLPTTAETLARVAETRLGFETLDKHLTLWHGLTLALGLSALTWLVGSLIFTQRARFQNIKTPWTANTLYYATLSGLEKLAVTFNQWIQVRPLPMHLRVMLWTIVVVVGYGLLRSSFALPILETIPLDFVPIALLLVAGAGGVLLARDAISAIIFTGLTGFGTAATFLVMRAPDLALTQLLIEAVTVILLLLALRFLPPLRARPRSPMFRVADFILALSVGVGVFAFLMASSSPLQERISTYYLENSYAEAGGRNVVNVILVDFRGYDTLGEIVVLAIVAVGVRALVKDSGNDDPILRTVARLAFYLVLVFAIHLLWRGHHWPGGGFIAGLMTAAGMVLYRVAFGQQATRLEPRTLLPWGLLIAALTGVGALLLGYPFLTSDYGYITTPLTGEFEWATALVFDIGVFLVVVGMTNTVIYSLAEARDLTTPKETKEETQ
jgi:monovalent cation:proton antiporter